MADNATAPRGVLVWLVGGPGAPGVGLTAVIAHQFDPVVLREYRLVLFSSRGTGTGALHCPQLQHSALTVPPPSAVHACAHSIEDNRRFYTTADTVADLDTLRQALRVDTLTLDGVSYGTFVAERYTITHPDRVSRLVLDSVVPHDGVDPLQSALFGRTADVLRMVCTENGCATDPAQDLSEVVRLRRDGPELLATLTALTAGKPQLTDIPAAAVFPYDRATAAGNAMMATCEQWPPTPVMAFPSGADLPPVPTLLLAGDHDLDTPWRGHNTRPPTVTSSSSPARGTSPKTTPTARRAAQPSPSS